MRSNQSIHLKKNQNINAPTAHKNKKDKTSITFIYYIKFIHFPYAKPMPYDSNKYTRV